MSMTTKAAAALAAAAFALAGCSGETSPESAVTASVATVDGPAISRSVLAAVESADTGAATLSASGLTQALDLDLTPDGLNALMATPDGSGGQVLLVGAEAWTRPAEGDPWTPASTGADDEGGAALLQVVSSTAALANPRLYAEALANGLVTITSSDEAATTYAIVPSAGWTPSGLPGAGAPAAVSVTVGADGRPSAGTIRATGGGEIGVTFSRWGEPEELKAPS